MESENFLDWTEPIEVPCGSREAQTYSMPVFFHAGVYLGLPAIYRIGTDRRVHTELAWSPDTVHWHRIDQGAQLIPLSEKEGAFDWGCIYAAATPVLLDEEIRIYYSAQPGRHGWNPAHRCLATLRPDGWAGYVRDHPSKPGVVVIRPLVCGDETSTTPTATTRACKPGGAWPTWRTRLSPLRRRRRALWRTAVHRSQLLPYGCKNVGWICNPS